MGGYEHEGPDAGGITAVLFAAVLGAVAALFYRGLREQSQYDPVAEAQRVARRALGIED
jgi:hypothetical protein